MKTTLFFWLVNFIPVSIALAVFEIWLECNHKCGSWGQTCFKNPYWEQPLPLQVPFLTCICRYHGIMFLLILPAIFCGEMYVWGNMLHYSVFPSTDHWYSNIFSAGMLLSAIWLATAGFEDIMFFSIQSLTGWHEPEALRRVLLEKNFPWFRNWLPPICGLHIPGHWVFCPTVSVTMLAVREYLFK